MLYFHWMPKPSTSIYVYDWSRGYISPYQMIQNDLLLILKKLCTVYSMYNSIVVIQFWTGFGFIYPTTAGGIRSRECDTI